MNGLWNTASRALLRRPTVGIAIAPGRLYATRLESPNDASAFTAIMMPLERDAVQWPSLVAALTEMRTGMPDNADDEPLRIAVALLPPLVQVRRVELPKLTPLAVRQLLSRTTARYFPSVHEPQRANAIALEPKSSPMPYLAASASSRLVDLIVRAAENAGCVVTNIVPAQVAWTAAALQRWPAIGRAGGDILVDQGARRDALRIERGRLVQSNRVLEEHHEKSGPRTHDLDRPEFSAAAYAHTTLGPELATEAMYAQRTTAQRQLFRHAGMVIAASILIAVGGVWWRARHELNGVIAERAQLKASVARATEGERAVNGVKVAATALERVETNAVVWSDVLRDVFSNLPKDASLIAVRARNDTITAEGVAAHGTGVFQQMDGTVLLDDVRPVGTIRREAKRGVTPLDRFTLVGHVAQSTPLVAAGKARTSDPSEVLP